MKGAAYVDSDLADIFYDRRHFICKKGLRVYNGQRFTVASRTI